LVTIPTKLDEKLMGCLGWCVGFLAWAVLALIFASILGEKAAGLAGILALVSLVIWASAVNVIQQRKEAAECVRSGTSAHE